MIINPNKIAFHSEYDVVDYVTKGFVPKQEDYQRVIAKLRHPDPISTINEKIGKEPVIPENMIEPYSAEILADALDRVYHNRKRNQKVCIGVAIGVTAACLVGATCCYIDKKDSKSDNEK